ncbi:hypothetical protein [Halarcobacter anaerophilus]|uniref:Uncharacterized protein n=1 Tax=Halarcobacter anaerophilus TaxID=877500 RepID=A0A4Q0XZX6_9BACT|nr:hypothetical protein [Halarcobacter anaerophilus]QDF29931.1 hypothetical protein AANAER_2475 [Halarcobacter anaerophilus]RXJ62893.1 hypothetical protein CRV06_08645 [Halarcobacter anaerophilus]
MAVVVKRSNLQKDKYKYIWNRDKGDGEYTGIQDKIRIDKDEGYEVLYFIEVFMNKHGMKYISDVHSIEDALHLPSFSKIVMRDELISLLEIKLGRA